MTGFSSVRSAAPPQNSLRPPQEQVAKPISEVGPAALGTPSIQHAQLPVRQKPEQENDAAKVLVRPDEDTPTGPPPAFEASLLEIETNLEIVIKRVEAAREKARIALAISPQTPWDQDAAPKSTLPL